MKQAVLSENQDLLLSTIEGGSTHPLCRVLYKNDAGDWDYLDDVLSANISRRGVDTRVGAFSIMPPVSSFSVSMSNKLQKYSPESGTKFSGILTRNRELRLLMGYRVGTVTEGTLALDLTKYGKAFYHTRVISGKVFTDISSATFAPSLTGFTFNTYGSGKYGSGTYDYEGYFLTRVIDLETLGIEIIENVVFDSDSSQIEAWYRSSRDPEDIEDLAFTHLGDTLLGSKSAKLPFLNSRYVQFVFLWKTGKWSTTENFLSALKLEYRNGDVLFEQGLFFADDPKFSSGRGRYTASFGARDNLRNSLANKISLPEMENVDVMEIVRLACDKAGIAYTPESLPLIGKTVSLVGDDVYTNETCQKVLEDLISYIAWTVSTEYRLLPGDDGRLKLTRKPQSAVVADHVLHYGYDLFSCDKGYSSNSLLQKATALKKNASTSPNELLGEMLFNDLGEKEISWPSPSIFKQVEVFYNDSHESTFVEILESTLTSVKLKILADVTKPIKVGIKVFGDVYTADVPYSGESFVSVNHVTTRKRQGKNKTSQIREGMTVTWINRFLSSDQEAKKAAEEMCQVHGNPKWQLSVTVRGMPHAEIGDRFMIFEKYTRTNSIFVLDTVNLSFSGKGAKFSSTLNFTDLGFSLENFVWDRNGKEEGDLDIPFDQGYLWDQDLGYVPNDFTDYSFLFPVETVAA